MNNGKILDKNLCVRSDLADIEYYSSVLVKSEKLLSTFLTIEYKKTEKIYKVDLMNSYCDSKNRHPEKFVLETFSKGKDELLYIKSAYQNLEKGIFQQSPGKKSINNLLENQKLPEDSFEFIGHNGDILSIVNQFDFETSHYENVSIKFDGILKTPKISKGLKLSQCFITLTGQIQLKAFHSKELYENCPKKMNINSLIKSERIRCGLNIFIDENFNVQETQHKNPYCSNPEFPYCTYDSFFQTNYCSYESYEFHESKEHKRFLYDYIKPNSNISSDDSYECYFQHNQQDWKDDYRQFDKINSIGYFSLGNLISDGESI